MAQQLKTNWNSIAEKLLEQSKQQPSPIRSLIFLGKWIRHYRTLRDRAKAIDKRLTAKAIKTMEVLNLDELQVSQRNFLLLKRVYKLPQDEAGQKIYDKLVDTYGQAFVDELYTKEEVMVPVHTVAAFSLDNKALNKLDKDVKRELGRMIGLTVSLDVGDVPQRAKEHKERRKR